MPENSFQFEKNISDFTLDVDIFLSKDVLQALNPPVPSLIGIPVIILEYKFAP